MSVTEKELAEAAVAERVTLEQVQSEAVAGEYFHSGLMTLCVLTLKNGFQVVGQSACASPENYNEEFGRKLALKDAENKIWMLLGFRLKDKLHKEKEANDLVAGLGGDGICDACNI